MMRQNKMTENSSWMLPFLEMVPEVIKLYFHHSEDLHSQVDLNRYQFIRMYVDLSRCDAQSLRLEYMTIGVHILLGSFTRCVHCSHRTRIDISGDFAQSHSVPKLVSLTIFYLYNSSCCFSLSERILVVRHDQALAIVHSLLAPSLHMGI
ncbi:hypothetical protein ABKN59_011771, partial [Abortiporus biennis]